MLSASPILTSLHPLSSPYPFHSWLEPWLVEVGRSGPRRRRAVAGASAWATTTQLFHPSKLLD
uniref:Uncharacterized protein n=1 Tax=Setaria viridis TaxID=4556 RepID=A0A4U6TP04_SETVI|nr:hypothetical protein SEVIR_7G039400v2 [Setaria viridis]